MTSYNSSKQKTNNPTKRWARDKQTLQRSEMVTQHIKCPTLSHKEMQIKNLKDILHSGWLDQKEENNKFQYACGKTGSFIHAY